MKRIPVLFLTIILVLSLSISSVCALDQNAEANDATSAKDFLVKDKFKEWCKCPELDPADPIMSAYPFGTFWDYNEVYSHYSGQDSQPDWILIKVHVELYSPVEDIRYRKFGHRVLTGWRAGAEFTVFDLAFYDVKNDTFTALDERPTLLDKYTELSEAIETLELGYMVGDADMDGEIGVIDATVIQRALARIESSEEYPDLSAVSMIGDLDGDGLDISDATRIQRFDVGLGDLYSD